MRSRHDVVNRTTLFDLSEPENREKGPQGVKIEFKNVFFKYPTRDVPVLSGLNMTVRESANLLSWYADMIWQIEKGQFAAIVGPSGSGKTSIISLIERFVKSWGHIAILALSNHALDSIEFNLAVFPIMAEILKTLHWRIIESRYP
jgi:ABC-type multidrug transport system fused ATPase/permease subunit